MTKTDLERPAERQPPGVDFKHLFESAPWGMFQGTGEKLLAANRALALLLGFESPGDLLAADRALEAFFAPPARWRELIQEAAASGRLVRSEVEGRRPDGSRFSGFLHLQAVRDQAGNPGWFEGFLEEANPSTRAGTEAHAGPDPLRQLAENLTKVFWLWDPTQTSILYVSPSYAQVWGRTCQSLYERPVSFAEAIHPSDRERVLASLKREPGGEGYEEEFRIVRPDGSVRWVHDRGFVMRDEAGKPCFARLSEDVTDRRQLAEQQRRAQRMEVIGQLAGGVAHDFNNILSATFMQLSLLQENPHLPPAMKESLLEVEKETLRAASITRQLLVFSRRQTARVEPLELNALLGELLGMLRLLGANIRITFRGAPGTLWVSADAGMMEQLVMNLCINARDAMIDGGEITLRTTLVERDNQAAQTHPDARPGQFVCLAVSDTGSGMDATVLGKLFEPFFTTKDAGQGTGLGLATVDGIVKQHAGWVEVASIVDQGTTFLVYLPAGEAPANRDARPELKEEIKGGTETILVVEDELSVRRLVALRLRTLGYAVLEAANPEEAVKVWALHRERIQLLFTDVVMPGRVSGRALAERFRQEKPGLKVIISTGHNPEPEGTPEQWVTCLPKPFQAVALARTVRRCLDKT